MLESPIQRLIPKAVDLLRMSVEQLAPILLKLAYEQRQQAGFIPRTVCDIVVSDGYPGWKKDEVETHLTRAWNWIERKGLIEPSPGINGQHGWRMFTDEGEAIANGANIEAIRVAQEFPTALLHKAIIADCEKLFWSGTTPRQSSGASRWCATAFDSLQAMKKDLKRLAKESYTSRAR